MLALVACVVPSAAAPERIAIVGGGLAGLATAIHLLDGGAHQRTPRVLHIYDPSAPGCGGASAVAAGLLHPFTPRGREIWQGREGFAASCALLARCGEAEGGGVSERTGLLRLALDDAQAEMLRAAADADDPEREAGIDEALEGEDALEQHWRSVDQAEQQAGGSNAGGGEAAGAAAEGAGGGAVGGGAVGGGARGAVFAPNARSVDTPAYLRALWALCETQAAAAGVEAAWCTRRVDALAELQEVTGGPYDAIIVAMGSRAVEITELQGLASVLRPCRGQNLLLENSADLRTPLISGKYVVPVANGAQLLAGATFEYDPPDIVHRPPDAEAAAAALLPSLAAIHPPLATARVLGAQAGVRALPPRSHYGYVPLLGRLPIEAGGSAAAAGGGEAGGGEASEADAYQPWLRLRSRKRGDEATDDPAVSVGAAAPSGGTWIFGGLGSRGLIHHALLGAAVAEAVLEGDETLLPEHTRRCQQKLPRLAWAGKRSGDA